MDFKVDDIMEWYVDLGGKRIFFKFLRTIWHVGDEDRCVVGFILN